MKKTITVLLCKRPDYSRQVLEVLSQVRGIEEWEVLVFCDRPGHQSDFLFHHLKMKDRFEEVCEVVKSFDFISHFKPSFRPLGLKAATLWSLREAFTKHRSDLNLHLEDDILIGPDALSFIEECAPFLTGNRGSITLQGGCEAGLPDHPTHQVYSHNYFTCGWGWATNRKFYLTEFMRAPDQGVPASWAINLAKLYESKGFCELRSNLCRSKNIGVEGTTHLKGPGLNGIGELNCPDVGDEWTGGKLDPVWESDLSLLTTNTCNIL